MLKILSASVLALSFATTALSQSFYVGTWVDEHASCSPDSDTGDYLIRLRLTETTMTHYESSCALTNPVSIRDINGILFDMVCTGEGEEWTERGLFIVDNEGGLLYHRRGRNDIYTLCD